jgi:hypothetical protein
VCGSITMRSSEAFPITASQLTRPHSSPNNEVSNLDSLFPRISYRSSLDCCFHRNGHAIRAKRAYHRRQLPVLTTEVIATTGIVNIDSSVCLFSSSDSLLSSSQTRALQREKFLRPPQRNVSQIPAFSQSSLSTRTPNSPQSKLNSITSSNKSKWEP